MEFKINLAPINCYSVRIILKSDKDVFGLQEKAIGIFSNTPFRENGEAKLQKLKITIFMYLSMPDLCKSKTNMLTSFTITFKIPIQGVMLKLKPSTHIWMLAEIMKISMVYYYLLNCLLKCGMFN